MKAQGDEFREWDPKITEWVTDLKRAWYLYDIATGKLENDSDMTLAQRQIPLWKRRKNVKPGDTPYWKNPVLRTAKWKGQDPEEKLSSNVSSWSSMDVNSDLDVTEFLGMQGREAAMAMLMTSEQILQDTCEDIWRNFAEVSTDPEAPESAQKAALGICNFVADIMNVDEHTGFDSLTKLLSGG